MSAPVDPRAVRALRERFGESLLTPRDDGYEVARAGWNARFDRRPGAIARCRRAADVAAAIEVAREHDLRLAVRSGGHDYAGYSTCDEGLVIDLGAMKRVAVDAERRCAVVEPGVTWGELDAATTAHGLATTGGTVSTVGVAGFVLGGGTGWLTRRCGLGVDNLIAADVVLASGEPTRASASDDADLLWALRGGSGNFGVATSLELRLHPIPERVLGGQIVHRHDAARDLLVFYRSFMAGAPDELACYPFFFRVPPIAEFPETLHGRTAASLVAAWTGAPEDGDAALAPLRGFGEPLLDTVATLPYVELQRSFDAGMAKGLRWCSRATYLDELSDAAIDLVARRTEHLPGEATVVYFDPLGGAASRVAAGASAFPHRGSAYGLHVFPGWSDPAADAANVAWASAFRAEMEAHSNGGVYVNMLDGDEPERVPAAYGRNYARLRELKRRYDPGNLFRSNQNVPPAG